MVHRILIVITILFLFEAVGVAREEEDLDQRAFLAPSPRIVALLRELKDEIKFLGQRYKVDPRAIAGAVLAENTMNSGLDEQIQTWLASRGTYEVAGRKFSFGLGQLYDFSAMKSERVLAGLDGREERSLSLVRRDVLTAEGSLYYVAGAMRDVQDVYETEGFSVKDKPELLATLYNIGKPEERAKRRRKHKGVPQPNYFGRFVLRNMSVIEEAIEFGLPPEGKSRALPPESFEEQVVQVRYPLLNDKVTLPKRMTTRFYHRWYDQLTNQPSAFDLTGAYRVVGRNVNGELKPYVLLEDQFGARGWIGEEELREKTHPSLKVKAFDCRTRQDVCIDSISKVADGKALEQDGESVLVDFGRTTGNLQTYYPFHHPLCLLDREDQKQYFKQHGVNRELPIDTDKWTWKQRIKGAFNTLGSLSSASKARGLDRQASGEVSTRFRDRWLEENRTDVVLEKEKAQRKQRAQAYLRSLSLVVETCSASRMNLEMQWVIQYDAQVRQSRDLDIEMNSEKLESLLAKCRQLGEANDSSNCETIGSELSVPNQAKKVVALTEADLEKTIMFEYMDLFAKDVSLKDVDCIYDPLQTADLVGRLSQLECVDLVTVPDEFLATQSRAPAQRLKVEPASRNGIRVRMNLSCKGDR